MTPTCPMCAEDVALQDVVCPHCGNVLRVAPPPPAPTIPPTLAMPHVAAPTPRPDVSGGYVVPLVLTLAALTAGVVWFASRRPSPAATPSVDAALALPADAALPTAPSPTPAAPAPDPEPTAMAADDEAPALGPEEPLPNGENFPEAPGTLRPQTVTASSYISNRRNQHAPERAFDGDPSTAWNENERGPGDGSWIAATFAGPVTVRRLRITTGYDASSPRHGDLFPLNSHLRRVRVTFDGGRATERDVAEGQRELVLDNLSVRARTVRIDALTVWPGARWADLCISEVAIEGS